MAEASAAAEVSVALEEAEALAEAVPLVAGRQDCYSKMNAENVLLSIFTISNGSFFIFF